MEAPRRPLGEVLDLDVLQDVADVSPGASAAWAPTRTFSSTVIVGKSSTFWNVRAMPRRTTLCGGVPSRSSPSNVISPDSGR